MTPAISAPQLAETLGFRRGIRVWFHNMPASIRRAIDPERNGIDEQACATDGMQGACLFVTALAPLERELHALVPLLAPCGFLWACWPAESAEDLNEPLIREAARHAGLSDTDARDINAEWRGVKMVVRRPAQD
ncbi:hypothetical protein ACX40Y_09955 [Sphingomonas sp. RS6]